MLGDLLQRPSGHDGLKGGCWEEGAARGDTVGGQEVTLRKWCEDFRRPALLSPGRVAISNVARKKVQARTIRPVPFSQCQKDCETPGVWLWS